MSVYVIQEPKVGPKGFSYDISPCLQFGQPMFIFDAYDLIGAQSKLHVFKARKRLESFDPMHDYILTAGGDPAGIMIVSMILAEKHTGFRYLRWERERGQNGTRTGSGFYIPTWIELYGTLQSKAV